MSRYRFDQWELDSARQSLSRDGQPVALEHRLLQLLVLLVENAGKPVSKDVMLERVWTGKVVGEDALYVSINQLRKLLGDKPRRARYIKTLPGVGYSFVGELSPVNAVSPKRRFFVFGGVATVLFGALTVLWMNLLDPNPSKEIMLPASISDDYRRARYLISLSASNQAEALELLKTVIEREPDYAPAHAELAGLELQQLLRHGSESGVELKLIRSRVARALVLAPEDKLVRLVAGNLAFWVDWDLAAAEEHYLGSLGTAEGHHAYAQLLLALGGFDRARKQVVQYQLLNPQGYSQPAVAWIANLSGDSSLALRELEALAELPEPGWGYHQSLQATQELLGNHTEAYRHLRWLMAQAGYSEHLLGEVDRYYREGGLPQVYRWLAFVDPEQRDIGQYRPPLSLARYAIKAGEPERGLFWLQQALARHQTELLWLGVDPAYAPVREHPQFAELLRKIGLPPRNPHERRG